MLVPDNAKQLDKTLDVARVSRGKNLQLMAGDVVYALRTLEYRSIKTKSYQNWNTTGFFEWKYFVCWCF